MKIEGKIEERFQRILLVGSQRNLPDRAAQFLQDMAEWYMNVPNLLDMKVPGANEITVKQWNYMTGLESEYDLR